MDTRFSPLSASRFRDGSAFLNDRMNELDPKPLANGSPVGFGDQDQRHGNGQPTTFRNAFLEINGREPSPQEIKHALAMARIAKDVDLDPILLMYLADAQGNDARERGLAEVRQATSEAVDRLKGMLSNNNGAEKSIGALQGFQTALNNVTALARHALGLG